MQKEPVLEILHRFKRTNPILDTDRYFIVFANIEINNVVCEYEAGIIAAEYNEVEFLKEHSLHSKLELKNVRLLKEFNNKEDYEKYLYS